MNDELLIPDKSHLPRLARRKEDTHFDRIWLSIYAPKNRVELSECEQGMRERYEFAWVLMRNLLQKREVVHRIMRKFDVKERQAYIDYYETKRLFGDAAEENKKTKKAVMSHMLEQSIKKAYKAEDWKALEKLILRYDKINGLSADAENPVAEMIKGQKPVAIIFDTNPETLKKQAEELMRGIKDVDYEEIDDSPRDSEG